MKKIIILIFACLGFAPLVAMERVVARQTDSDLGIMTKQQLIMEVVNDFNRLIGLVTRVRLLEAVEKIMAELNPQELAKDGTALKEEECAICNENTAFTALSCTHKACLKCLQLWYYMPILLRSVVLVKMLRADLTLADRIRLGFGRIGFDDENQINRRCGSRLTELLVPINDLEQLRRIVTKIREKANELKKLCLVCIKRNTDLELSCGHAGCIECLRAVISQGNNCILCQKMITDRDRRRVEIFSSHTEEPVLPRELQQEMDELQRVNQERERELRRNAAARRGAAIDPDSLYSTASAENSWCSIS